MVSVAFITFNNKILLFHRDDKSIKDPDCWDLVGGHDEPGESPEDTLKRETQEEISIAPEKIRYLFPIADTWAEETHLFHVQLSEKEVASIKLGNEGKEVVFFEIDEVKKLKLSQNMHKYFREYPNLIESLLAIQ
ncbi:MAG: NUDIX domain-containing protein [bacterium]|nr:NUDIX domain-containing protein [bacterium]